jgi:hypothetical protein
MIEYERSNWLGKVEFGSGGTSLDAICEDKDHSF